MSPALANALDQMQEDDDEQPGEQVWPGKPVNRRSSGGEGRNCNRDDAVSAAPVQQPIEKREGKAEDEDACEHDSAESPALMQPGGSGIPQPFPGKPRLAGAREGE